MIKSQFNGKDPLKKNKKKINIYIYIKLFFCFVLKHTRLQYGCVKHWIDGRTSGCNYFCGSITISCACTWRYGCLGDVWSLWSLWSLGGMR